MVREEIENCFGPKKMTKKTIQASCRKNKLYLTPHLNDVLYLHYSGYNSIECLEEYVGLKCLWLECNAISTISGLHHQPQLRCLYLHNNLIKKIENLEHCTQLDTLNLSHNHITKVENCGIDILPVLNTLNLSHNYLKTVESIEELGKCDFVSVLDISHNRIEDIAVVKVLAGMKGLRVLTLTGNPVVNDIPSYRKTLILECKSLTYLDSRPVFDKDRACALAWKRGGYQEEQKEHIRWKKEEKRKMKRNINATLRLRHRGDGEPELLKTSSDEEEDAKSEFSAGTQDDLQYESNDVAWKEMANLFNQHLGGLGSASQPSTSDKPFSGVNACKVEEKLINEAAETKEVVEQPLVEEISREEYVHLTARKDLSEVSHETSPEEPNQDVSTNEVGSMKPESRDEQVASLPEAPRREKKLIEDETTTSNMENMTQDEDCSAGIIEAESEAIHGDPIPDTTIELQAKDQTADPRTKQSLGNTEKEKRIAVAEKEETLNVVIQSKEISITMQPSCSDANYTPPATVEGCEQVEQRKASVASIDYVTGSDSNSDPTLVTDCDSCIRNSSLAYSSRSDTSDSEDMFDKIVPKKHRKLASSVRTDASSTSTSSSGGSDSDGATGRLGSKLDRQNTITEFIDEYKQFFRSVDIRDPKCVVKNRHKIVRPQTAKTQRTDPLIYDGVLKTMEQQSNCSKIEQARQEMVERTGSVAKESVFDRLLKGHTAVDMNMDSSVISIGGKEHNFNEYRLDVFRKDQEKLQTLIDRVTAQKDKYNAHIDSIHDQLANIMEDYGQISEKLKRVDDMIQTIGNEVTKEERDAVKELVDESPQLRIVEQIVENMTKQQTEPQVDMRVEQHPSSDESNVSSLDIAPHLEEMEDDLEAASHIEIEEGVTIDVPHRKPIPDEFRADPVYRKFIDIQHEIDKLTEDEIFHVLSEAARELHGDEERQTQVLHDQVDEYWARGDDVDSFRRSLNLNAHPIIKRFKHFIECQCETDTDSEDREHVRKLEQAYQKYERRLSNHLFDEYLIMSRKVSIATTNGGESSAAEMELIEIEPETEEAAGSSTFKRSNAWELKESFDVATEGDLKDQAPNKPTIGKLEELEDDESKPEVDCASSKKAQCIDDKEEH